MQPPQSFEGQYLDVLHNIESGITRVYRRQPELVDFDVDNALNALVRHYGAEIQQRAAPPARLTPLAQAVYDSVLVMCEWRLGRAEIGPAEGGATIPQPEPITAAEIVACLKRIRKSVQRWTKEGGRRGYLTFVEGYV
jgi:hypothetical protein